MNKEETKELLKSYGIDLEKIAAIKKKDDFEKDSKFGRFACFVGLKSFKDSYEDELFNEFLNAINTSDVGVNATIRDEYDNSENLVLNIAVKHNYFNTFIALLNNGADVNMADKCGVTPLIIACVNGNLKMVEILLLMGADPNHVDSYGTNPLMNAYISNSVNREKIAKLLIEYGAKPYARTGYGITAKDLSEFISSSEKSKEEDPMELIEKAQERLNIIKRL